ncbi:MAG: Lysine-tRNA ligase [Parcubacteria group bacterium GW2011_GWA2_44_12]|nr:MAG: Lysine-tRNA ligase [Parcubacteria group bacterium GW2011_GWA2_44_12]
MPEESDISEYHLRSKKRCELYERGINPYPAHTKRTHSIAEALDGFTAMSSGKIVIALSGRVRSMRTHGGSTFAHIEDGMGVIQVYFKKDSMESGAYEFLHAFVGIGDFIEVEGVLFLTKTNEKTLLADRLRVLSKTLRPLPEKWKGLIDKEGRYRKRYLDLISNKDVRELFQKRTFFINTMRNFLVERGYMEVEVPVLEHIPGGADALPFITRHNTLDINLYLRISLELHLKRLIVGGFDKVFELGKVFRNEGMSTQHLQEFTMMECYEAYQDYTYYMQFVEDMYTEIILKTFGSLRVVYKNGLLDFSPKWPRKDYQELFHEHTGIDLSLCREKDELVHAAKKLGTLEKVDFSLGRGRIIDLIYKRLVRPKLIGPLFLINHPVEISPLAKRRETDQFTTERFQVIIDGSEVGNGFSELNDPVDQKQRFEEQMKLREAGDKEAHMLDEDYIEALEHGMPPTAGFGLGIDRLFAIASNQDSVRDVVLFPIMRQK